MIRRVVCLLYKKGCIDTLVSMIRVSMCQYTGTALEGGCRDDIPEAAHWVGQDLVNMIR